MVGLFSRMTYWGMLEMGLAIVVACLPVLQSLVRKIWPLDLWRSIQSFLSRRAPGHLKTHIFQDSQDHFPHSQTEGTRTQTPHLSVPGEIPITGDLERQ